MTAPPNFFTTPEAWNRVKIGGQLVLAVLRKVAGNGIKYEWTKQKATGTSGAANVPKGLDPPGDFKFTFLCADTDEATAEEQFEDAYKLYERFKPVPVATGGPAKSQSPYVNASAPKNANAGGVIPANPASASTTDKDGFPKNTAQSPGPRPPTLSIESGFTAWYGVTAISFGEFEGPNPTETNGIEFTITFVTQKAVTPASTAIVAPKDGDQFVGGSGGNPGGGNPMDKGAAKAGSIV